MFDRKQLALIFDFAPVPFTISNLNSGKYIAVNKAFCKIMEYSQNEVIGKTSLELNIWQRKEDRETVVNRLKQDGFIRNFETNFITKTGKIKTGILSSVIVELNKEPHLLTIAQDITDLKEAQASLREREKHLATILKSIGDAVIAVDKNSSVIHMNKVAEQLTGWSFEDAEGEKLDKIFNIVNAKTGRVISNPVAKVFKDGKIVGLANDTILIAKNGKEYNIADSAAPIRDENGNIKGVVLIFRDITEKYKRDKELKETKEFLQAVFNSIKDGISVLNNDLTIRYVNPVMEEWYQNSKPLVGKKCFEAYHNVKKPCESCPSLRCISTGKREVNIVPGYPGSSKWLELYSYPIKDAETGEVTGIVEFVRDITDRIIAEKERIKFSKLDSLGILAGGIAHDFNNILTGLFGNLEIAKLKLTENHPSFRFIETAETALNRARNLTNQLLTFSKGGEPLLGSVDLKSLIEDIVQFNLAGSSIKANFKHPKSLWQVKADKEQISQVISNLTINAKQAMPNGGNIYIETENIPEMQVIFSKFKGRFVKLTVRDEGIGIPQEYLDKIFDPFFTTKQSGSGLGLAIVFSIIKKHNGYINVSSESGKGTCFAIYLPAETDENFDSASNTKALLCENRIKSARILLMDDEDMVRDVAKDMLEAFGFIVECVSNGEEALEKYTNAILSENPFDVVIMDLTIRGGMGGEEAAKKILKIDENAKIIVASGYSNSPVMANYQYYGFKNALTKPFKMYELQESVKKLLNSGE